MITWFWVFQNLQNRPTRFLQIQSVSASTEKHRKSYCGIDPKAIITCGGKTSFCLINIRQPLPNVTTNAAVVHGRGGTSCGNIQGISAGYSAVYSASLDDQWIDITNVADGTYWLEITAAPDNNILESNESNNVSRIQVTIDNGQVSSALSHLTIWVG